MKVWKVFAASRRVRIVCFALAGALLVASVVGLGLLAAAPVEDVLDAKYEHRGQFDYTVYLKPSVLYGDAVPTGGGEEGGSVPMIFFRDIIEEVGLSFSYSFDSVQPLTGVSSKVVVSIIAENPGVWQKRMVQLEETHTGQELRVEFPLALASLEKVVAEIEQEIAINTSQRNFTIRASVQTTAETALGKTIRDTFTYELEAVVTGKRLELKGSLEDSSEGYTDGIGYAGKGRFDYEVRLKPNKLYETTVLRSEPAPVTQPPTPPKTLGPGLVYFPRMITNIEAHFSYQFLCDKPIREQSQEVEVIATIENPEKWSRTLVVVPKTSKVGGFSMSFPMDIRYFTMVIDAIGQETGVRGTSHNIVLEANVHTVVVTDAGTLDEAYTQTLGAKLEANSLTFDKELSRSESGTISGATIDGGSGERRSKTAWIIGLIIGLLALGYFGWAQTRLGRAPVSAGEAEAARARKKYKQLLVDVDALPEVKATETVIPLISLDDLVRIADDLARPVLYQAGGGRHSYCVIDSGVRYLYERCWEQHTD